MGWIDVARLGGIPARIDESVARLAKAPNDLAARATPVLDEMAATSPDGAGIERARALLAAALPTFADRPKYKTSNGNPSVQTVRQCALVLYHGLLVRAGAAVKAMPQPDDEAVALVEAARGIDGFRATLLSDLLLELRFALGTDLYDRAVAALDARAKP